MASDDSPAIENVSPDPAGGDALVSQTLKDSDRAWQAVGREVDRLRAAKLLGGGDALVLPSELQLAERIARMAHDGQKEESTGDDYIRHVARVVALVDGDEAKAVAWLHDVLEDSDLTDIDLRANAISVRVVNAVLLLTRREPFTYSAYIDQLKSSGDVLALQVKIADLKDHLRPNCPERLRPRYEQALQVLMGDALVSGDEGVGVKLVEDVYAALASGESRIDDVPISKLLKVQKDVTDLRAALALAQQEKDEARARFDRQVVWSETHAMAAQQQIDALTDDLRAVEQALQVAQQSLQTSNHARLFAEQVRDATRVLHEQSECRGDKAEQALVALRQALDDDRLLELWRSVQGPRAELTGPLIRFAGLVRAALTRSQP